MGVSVNVSKNNKHAHQQRFSSSLIKSQPGRRVNAYGRHSFLETAQDSLRRLTDPRLIKTAGKFALLLRALTSSGISE